MTLIFLNEHIEDSTSQSPAVIARKWKNIGNRIRGKVANLIAEERGKKSLKDGTKERLEGEILKDIEFLAQSRKANDVSVRDIVK